MKHPYLHYLTLRDAGFFRTTSRRMGNNVSLSPGNSTLSIIIISFVSVLLAVIVILLLYCCRRHCCGGNCCGDDQPEGGGGMHPTEWGHIKGYGPASNPAWRPDPVKGTYYPGYPAPLAVNEMAVSPARPSREWDPRLYQ